MAEKLSVVYVLRLTPRLKTALDATARRLRVPAQNVARVALGEYLARHGNTPDKAPTPDARQR